MRKQTLWEFLFLWMFCKYNMSMHYTLIYLAYYTCSIEPAATYIYLYYSSGPHATQGINILLLENLEFTEYVTIEVHQAN